MFVKVALKISKQRESSSICKSVLKVSILSFFSDLTYFDCIELTVTFQEMKTIIGYWWVKIHSITAGLRT